MPVQQVPRLVLRRFYVDFVCIEIMIMFKCTVLSVPTDLGSLQVLCWALLALLINCYTPCYMSEMLIWANKFLFEKLVSAVTDEPRDAVCPINSYQLFHESQLPQSECAMLRVTINGRTRRPNCVRWVYGRSTCGRPSEVRSMNLEHPSVGELYWQHLATTDLLWRNFLSSYYSLGQRTKS